MCASRRMILRRVGSASARMIDSVFMDTVYNCVCTYNNILIFKFRIDHSAVHRCRTQEIKVTDAAAQLGPFPNERTPVATSFRLPSRADHVGSFLRPRSVLENRAHREADNVSAGELRRVED